MHMGVQHNFLGPRGARCSHARQSLLHSALNFMRTYIYYTLTLPFFIKINKETEKLRHVVLLLFISL